ncbi:EF-P beta-lysylation protein EpmB [Piscirickettsia salmonis]|uniref:L-lysine 2,3-aminomutase n=1 Tax=Piscirickettsia salmonis TaxID=1238 RepID=A0A9Q6LQY1_PISSA|nr:EF-P beta-lysylation protein EpmB [Piscirickettsia salmonis]ALA26096.1 kamA family protein [Piscirickettsia salmonis]APS43546.1 EF-P beta-lysylation protein EpmB [Piscirickettsia salmonis]APS46899.1 EF-P beta-lysylation protein EpmB [Piscirickettsia salmonis]APS51649.1 EF-P beta-lysylation protein EpmB [Piscirickettsia salmonis]APS54866.1 EF-P beta-lysylation protein EpmB [Piscirickettsia salmonis]
MTSIIHGSSTKVQRQDWQTELKNAFRCPKVLLSYLELDPEQHLPGAKKGHQLFKTIVPLSFAKRIEKANPTDPLLLQVLPSSQEATPTLGYNPDPLEERNYNPTTGLLHKYHNRVLFITSGNCPVNCRYCFRRHFPYNQNNPSKAGWLNAINYIQNHPEIDEVILSGGDPLSLKDSTLFWLINQLEAVPHLKYLRIHSRFPVMIPSRITDDFLTILKNTRFISTVVIHSNHPQEIDDEVNAALLKLKHAGITTLNQGLLLKGINNSSEVLIKLSHRLYQSGVLPYYLHLLDPVEGAGHFDIQDKEAAKTIIKEMMEKLPGYLVPKLAYEEPGRAYKVTLSPFSS